MRATIERLQALRGITTISAVMLVAGLGELPRFAHKGQLLDHARGQSCVSTRVARACAALPAKPASRTCAAS